MGRDRTDWRAVRRVLSRPTGIMPRGWSVEDYRAVGKASPERQAELEAMERAAKAIREGAEPTPADISLAMRALRRVAP